MTGKDSKMSTGPVKASIKEVDNEETLSPRPELVNGKAKRIETMKEKVIFQNSIVENSLSPHRSEYSGSSSVRQRKAERKKDQAIMEE